MRLGMTAHAWDRDWMMAYKVIEYAKKVVGNRNENQHEKR